MDKKEFLDRLRSQLTDLTVEERREALEYYEEYFADAGEENEEDVILSLGTPEQVAEQIKAGLHKEEEGMFTENGYREKIESDNPPEVYGKKTERQKSRGTFPWGRGKRTGAGYQNASGSESSADGHGGSGYAGGRKAGGYGSGDRGTDGPGAGGYGDSGQNAGEYRTEGGRAGGQNADGYRGNGYHGAGQSWYDYGGQRTGRKKEGMSGGMIALLVILGIFASPVIFGLCAALFGVVLGIFGAVLGVIAALFAVVIALLAAGLALFFGGFPMLLYHPFSGMICIAVGCFLIALFLVCVVLLVSVFSRFFPWLIRGVESFGKYLSRKWSERKERGKTV